MPTCRCGESGDIRLPAAAGLSFAGAPAATKGGATAGEQMKGAAAAAEAEASTAAREMRGMDGCRARRLRAAVCWGLGSELGTWVTPRYGV